MEALSIFFVCFHAFITAADTMAVNQTIRDGETIVSPQQTFELGFFSPTNTSHNRYLGTWYKREATGTVAWVANRETPITNKSGQLTLHPGGVLVLRDSATNKIIWSSNTSTNTTNPVARLSDTGNFMVTDSTGDGSGNYIWQSFDHPGDTYLPRMKFGKNLETGTVTNFTSWKSDDDPSQGPYMVYMDFNGLPQIFQKNGDVIQYRLGSWNGLAHTGSPIYTQNPIYTTKFVSNEREIYAEFDLINSSVLSKMRLSPAGNMDQLNWNNRTQEWFLYLTPTVDSCVRYALCGVYGSCEITQSPPCGCLKGFTPKNPDQWNEADWTSGCQREVPLDCGVKEGFRKYSSVKLPDTRQSWFDTNMTLEQCEVKCKNECNCTAYTTLNIKYGSGCLLWYHELIDMRTFPDSRQDIYIRMAASELEQDKRGSRSNEEKWIILIIGILGLAILLVLYMLIKRKCKSKEMEAQEKDVLELPLFSLSTLLDATNNFSDNNKLGQGGFGSVYKGSLKDGREVAVKRLSKSSKQGVEEFRNEVIFISKLQHRNLVKILGWCNEDEEKMLVYEYMPNKSLDLHLFDETKSKLLDWSHRFHIIIGIARGLLYLHHDSQLLVIHRDLKVANILLDNDMKPKISDFGLARSFGGNEIETNTKRVVGTYGYMSPEYAGEGIFSIKSDVFGFGVLVLEIVSGKKNRGFFHAAHGHNLIGHAWKLYKEAKTLELADPSLIKTINIAQVLRAIHVGLLCVQHSPKDRPNMSTVVVMLGSEGRLPEPKQPGFFAGDDKYGPEHSPGVQTQISNNDVTVTLLDPR